MQYLTIAEAIKQNGDRHKANAEKYLAEGNLHHAVGSLRKALKNYEKALLFAPDPFVILQPMIDNLEQQIAKEILNV